MSKPIHTTQPSCVDFAYRDASVRPRHASGLNWAVVFKFPHSGKPGEGGGHKSPPPHPLIWLLTDR